MDAQLVSFSFAPLPLFNLLMMFKLIFCFMALAVLVQASPLSRRAARACTCGTNVYSASAVDSALTKGLATKKGKYPHTFFNIEKIPVVCAGRPIKEFPLLPGGALYQKGTRPGTDRVLFDSAGDFCGCITHTGAPVVNGFVKCTS